MIALHFGSTEAPLFGVYHPARGARPHPHGVVICPAFGTEYMLSHFAVRRIAMQLAERGFDVLRFDYSGTGDSAGAQEDVSLEAWLADIRTAVRELMETTGQTKVSLLGVRFGAGLAVEVAARAGDSVHSVLAWDPVLRGAEYLAWMEQAEAALHPNGTKGTQVLGHPLPPAFRAQVAAFDATAAADALADRLLRLGGLWGMGAERQSGDGLFELALRSGDIIVDQRVVNAVADLLTEALP